MKQSDGWVLRSPRLLSWLQGVGSMGKGRERKEGRGKKRKKGRMDIPDF